MYSMIKDSDNIVYDVKEYVCDSVEDLNLLPKCKAGSTAIVLVEGNTTVYMKNSEGKWVKL